MRLLAPGWRRTRRATRTARLGQAGWSDRRGKVTPGSGEVAGGSQGVGSTAGRGAPHGPAGLGCIGLHWVALGCIGLDWAGSGRVGLHWAGLGRIGPDQAGPSWTGLAGAAATVSRARGRPNVAGVSSPRVPRGYLGGREGSGHQA